MIWPGSREEFSGSLQVSKILILSGRVGLRRGLIGIIIPTTMCKASDSID